MELLNFDANAGHGLTPFVQQRLEQVGFDLLNPSSIHRGGQRARSLIEEARTRLALLMGIGADSRIIFTSGATEANNTALQIPFQGRSPSGHLLSSAVEHPSVLSYAETLRARGIGLDLIAASQLEGFSQSELLAKLKFDSKLVSLIWVCNETGQIYPLAEMISGIRLKAPHTLIHTDAVQALGKIRVDFGRSGLDMITISGHKIGALSGIGALVIGRRVPFQPLLLGGSQEQYHRAGTENVLGIVSLGLAAEEISQRFEQRIAAMESARDMIVAELSRELPYAIINTPLERSVANTLNISIPDVRADDLVVALDRVNICISSGAACSSGKPTPSHVLLALGLSEQQARESVRISVRGDCTTAQTERFIAEFVRAVNWMGTGAKKVVGM